MPTRFVDSTNMKVLCTLFVSFCLCISSSQAFVSFLAKTPSAISRNPLHHVRAQQHHHRTWKLAPAVAGAGSRRQRGGSLLSMLNLTGKGSRMKKLSEEQLISMEKAREEVNQKLDSFLEERRAVKVARLEGQEEELRLQATNRLSAEIEDAEHNKVYIPQRLEEIVGEEVSLEERVSAFNDKIKDTNIDQL